jgi:hypothetical protein
MLALRHRPIVSSHQSDRRIAHRPVRCLARQENDRIETHSQSIAATTLSAILLSSQPAAAWAYESVPAAQVSEMARPLPKQQIDKPKVWTTFVGGAAVLFLTTIALENNSSLFPAIAKANQAASEAKKKMEEVEKKSKQEEAEYQEVSRQSALVEAGLREAKERLITASDPEVQKLQPSDKQQRLQEFVDQVTRE